MTFEIFPKERESSRLVFSQHLAPISAGTSAIVTLDFHSFHQSSQANTVAVHQNRPWHFLPNVFKFIIHTTNQFCDIGIVLKIIHLKKPCYIQVYLKEGDISSHQNGNSHPWDHVMPQKIQNISNFLVGLNKSMEDFRVADFCAKMWAHEILNIKPTFVKR